MGELRHVDRIDDAMGYAQDVVGGRIVACKWVKAACQRQLDDLVRFETDVAYPFAWRPDLAERAIDFLERLTHVKGRWAGEYLRLAAWQRFSVACVFGWVRKDDGTRRFRSVYEEVPRKNAKTTKLAGIALYGLTADSVPGSGHDGEFGAEVYSAATTKDQARIVFSIAQQMARADGQFRARFHVRAFKNHLERSDNASVFKPLSAEGENLDGLNVSMAVVDELHAHKTRTVHDVLDSGTGSRAQPLIWKITTAGSNRAGVCYDQRSYLIKILNGVLKRHDGMGYGKVTGNAIDDETFWGIIYTIDEGDDEFDPATWRKANPNYDISVLPADLERMATVAKAQAAALAEFRTKRLNVWVNADTAWMNMLQWDACANPSLREDMFHGKPCIQALDAAFKKDLFARVKLFREANRYTVFARFYAPEALLQRSGMEQLGAWAAEGWIRTTPGEVLDIEAVREELIGDGETVVGDAERFELTECGYDPAQLTQFATELLKEGLPMVEIRPLVNHFSPAMKELEELVAARRLQHDGNPVLAWMIANVVCHRDAKDNIFPRKERPDDKIDGAVALIMALSRALAPAEDDEVSFWEARAAA